MVWLTVHELGLLLWNLSTNVVVLVWFLFYNSWYSMTYNFFWKWILLKVWSYTTACLWGKGFTCVLKLKSVIVSSNVFNWSSFWFLFNLYQTYFQSSFLIGNTTISYSTNFVRKILNSIQSSPSMLIKIMVKFSIYSLPHLLFLQTVLRICTPWSTI